MSATSSSTASSNGPGIGARPKAASQRIGRGIPPWRRTIRTAFAVRLRNGPKERIPRCYGSTAAGSCWLLLFALVLGTPAPGAFVSLAQATLMDADPPQRVRNMARWTLAGSFGYVGGPLLLVLAVYAGFGWRGAIAALAIAALPLTFAATRFPSPQRGTAPPLGRAVRDALTAIRRREVLRLLLTLEASDLLLDVFHGFLALHLVDAVGP